MTAAPATTFAMGVDFAEGRPVVRLFGEVDIDTAPELGAVLDAMLQRSHEDVVIDVAALDFIDGRGVSVLEHVAVRLRVAGGQLTIRSPDRMVQWLMGATQLLDVVHVEPAGSDAGLGMFLRTGQIAAHHDVLESALRAVVLLAGALVDGADEVTVSLAPQGQLLTVVARDAVVEDLDRAQYDAGEGPCLEAGSTGVQFHVHSTDTDERWPTYLPRARERGVRSILSTPLAGPSGAVGALNMYSFEEGSFASDAARERAEVFAAGAADIVGLAGLDASDIELGGRVHAALRTRHTIALAQGILMERERLSADAAFDRLRLTAHRTEQPLRTVAVATVVEAESAG